jgi:hypothetical protein
MEIRVLVDGLAVTQEAAKVIAAEERAAVAARARVRQEHALGLDGCRGAHTVKEGNFYACCDCH